MTLELTEDEVRVIIKALTYAGLISLDRKNAHLLIRKLEQYLNQQTEFD